MNQGLLFSLATAARAPKGQLLKWIGNKHRMAEEIASYLPEEFNTYHEPFLGGGAVLATLAPSKALASDAFGPLIEIWSSLYSNPETPIRWYAERWHRFMSGERVSRYEEIKASFNAKPSGADLLFLCRSCYGGVVRFRKDGYMSTPVGIHQPISPESFSKRAEEWHRRIQGTEFAAMGYEEAMSRAKRGDVVYCDPPYTHTQAILYGAQAFSLKRLLEVIEDCKRRGVFVALSIDGTKKSGNLLCDLPIPEGLFKREIRIDCGRSMLRRFQVGGDSVESEVVADRLLLTS